MPTKVMYYLRVKSTRKLPFNLRLFIFSSFAITSACTILQSAFFAFVAAKSTALRSAFTHRLYLALSLKWSQHGGADWNTRASVFFHENNRLLDPVFFLRSVAIPPQSGCKNVWPEIECVTVVFSVLQLWNYTKTIIRLRLSEYWWIFTEPEDEALQSKCVRAYKRILQRKCFFARRKHWLHWRKQPKILCEYLPTSIRYI